MSMIFQTSSFLMRTEPRKTKGPTRKVRRRKGYVPPEPLPWTITQVYKKDPDAWKRTGLAFREVAVLEEIRRSGFRGMYEHGVVRKKPKKYRILRALQDKAFVRRIGYRYFLTKYGLAKSERVREGNLVLRLQKKLQRQRTL